MFSLFFCQKKKLKKPKWNTCECSVRPVREVVRDQSKWRHVRSSCGKPRVKASNLTHSTLRNIWQTQDCNFRVNLVFDYSFFLTPPHPLLVSFQCCWISVLFSHLLIWGYLNCSDAWMSLFSLCGASLWTVSSGLSLLFSLSDVVVPSVSRSHPIRFYTGSPQHVESWGISL